MVAGDIEDANLFKDIFDNQESLDIVSGSNVVFFLFANRQTKALELEVEGGRAEVLAGEVLIPEHINFAPGIWYLSISDINTTKIRDEVIKNSQTITHQITKQFKLTGDDIPCILILGKGEAEPWVLRTKGEAEVKDFHSFLHDLRLLADSIPKDYELYWPRHYASFLMTEQELSALKQKRVEVTAELQTALLNLGLYLEKHGMVSEISEQVFTLQNAKQVWEITGYRKDIRQPDFAQKHENIFREARRNEAFRTHCRNVARTSKKLTNIEKQLTRNERFVLRLQAWVTRNLSRMNTYTTNDAIDNLCNRYSRKFQWKHRTRPLRNFAVSFLGTSKQVGDTLSTIDLLKKLIP